MIKIGITGSLASGKSTVAKLISRKKHPIFCADTTVKKLYRNKIFLKKIIDNFKLLEKKKIKTELSKLIINNQITLKRLEKLIHPEVRKKMKKFISANRKKKLIILEIPLLIESNLKNNFDIVLFVGAKKYIRLRRYIKKGGNKKMFTILDRRQMNSSRKIKLCNYSIKNNKSLKLLKKNVNIFLKKYD